MQSAKTAKTYRETVIRSTVLQADAGYYLQVPDGWIGSQVYVDIDGKLVRFLARSSAIVDNDFFKPHLGKELEVQLVQLED